MNKNILLIMGTVVLGGVIAYLRNREVKIKLPSWKKMVLIGILIFVCWYNWTGIKSFVLEIFLERSVDKVSFLSQKSKTDLVQKELEDLEEKAKERPLTSEELDSLTKIKTAFQPPAPRRRQIIVETIDLPAGKVVETGISFEEGDRIEYEKNLQDKKNYFWLINKPENIKVTRNNHLTRTISSGVISTKGGPKDLKVTIKIIPGYYLK